MHRVLKGLAVSACLALLGSTGALAEAPPPDSDSEPDRTLNFIRPGIYIAVTGNYQKENFDIVHDAPGLSGGPDNSTGVTFRAGYRINKWVASEFQAEFMPSFIEDDPVNGNGFVIGANARLYIPVSKLSRRFQPVVIAGANWMSAGFRYDGRKDGFAIRSGLGLEAYITDHFAVLLEGTYVAPLTDDLRKFPFGSIGGGFAHRF